MVEVGVEAEGDPSLRRQRTRRAQAETGVQHEREFDALEGTLYGRLAYFSVSLGRVSVPDREERTRDRDGEEQGTTGRKLLAVYVPAGDTGRRRGMEPWLFRWHPHDTHKGLEGHGMSVLVASYEGMGVQGPAQFLFAVCHAKTVVPLEWYRASCYRSTPDSYPQVVDTYFQSHAWLGSPYLDGAAQGVAFVAPLGAEVLEASALTVLPGGLQPPSRLERAENDCVTRIYAQSRRQVPRERAVKRLSTWFYDMHRHSYAPPQRT